MQSSAYWVRLQLSKGCFPEVLFVQSSAHGIQSTSVLPEPLALLHRLCSCQSIRYNLQSSKGCASPAPLVQSSVYWVRLRSSEGCLLLPLVQLSIYQIRSTIIQGMRFSSTARAVISLLGTVTIIQGMPSSTARAVVSLSDTVYNHPRDALLQHRSCSH